MMTNNALLFILIVLLTCLSNDAVLSFHNRIATSVAKTSYYNNLINIGGYKYDVKTTAIGAASTQSSISSISINDNYNTSSNNINVVESLKSITAIATNNLFMNPLHLSQSQPVRVRFPYLNILGKVLTPWGVYNGLIFFATAAFILPIMLVQTVIADLTGNSKRRRMLDWMIHIWAGISVSLCFTSGRLYGTENLPAHNETVVYVPNHTSFMDILLLSAYVPRPFKYLSKEEIKYIPFVGAAMTLAKHVFLKRSDLRSTIQVTETCIERLKDGNSLVLFAEGTRSTDGKLTSFKKGAFQMAKQAGVKVVPVSIGNLHRWMPKNALLPLEPIRNTYVKIHPAIDTSNKTISEIRSLCYEAVNSGLPPYQQNYNTKMIK